MFKQEDGNKWDGRMPRVTGGAIPFIDIKSHNPLILQLAQ